MPEYRGPATIMTAAGATHAVTLYVGWNTDSEQWSGAALPGPWARPGLKVVVELPDGRRAHMVVDSPPEAIDAVSLKGDGPPPCE